MGDAIFLLGAEGELVELVEEPYASEDLLQELLACYPRLLAGGQIDNASPRRGLLVSREAALPSEEGGSGRWATDHLFLDQDAVPTIVEVKRSSDTRTRREVVGQMIDYAANAVVYWPIETVRALFEARCDREGIDSDDRLSRFLDGGAAEEFWKQAKTNLQAGRVRLIFVADEIPRELRRVVEFLNEQMDPAEVLAVEVKQFVGHGRKTLVPRVVGQTAEAQRKKSGRARESRQWDKDSFFAGLTTRNPEEAAVAHQLYGWATENMSRIWWGKGSQLGSFIPFLDFNDTGHSLFAVWTNGTVAIQFGYMQRRPPFTDETVRRDILYKLNDIPGIKLPDDAITRFPSIPLTVLQEEGRLEQFFRAMEGALETIRAS